MKKAFKVLLSIILLVVVVLAVVFFVVLPATLNSAAKLQTYDMGTDKIPSFNSIVGERKVTGVGSSSSTSGSQQKNYSYETASLGDDLDAYVDGLRAAGLYVLRVLDGNKLKGNMQLGINSAEEGKMILLDLSWDSASCTVLLTKGVGTITPNP